MDDRNERLRQRLEELKREKTLGDEQLRALDQRKRELEHTLLRISGAIQVLEDMLSEPEHG